MIPFASQRGGGQDLATHLMNAHDNEQVTLFDVRGAVARDLHGALAEWEAIAGALTRCRQYLCSLSINPDERQSRLTRDQYLDYIARAEAALGLAGQPRAIIFHVKRDGHGRAREHCHVVWSRIDVEKKRAVPLSFFKEKMMAVTRAFARDHGLALPPGYNRQEDAQRRNRQLSSYDCIKQKQTGISHEERIAAVSDAWRRSDSARAFVNALADLGYILAQGRNGTRVVLVDFYGHTTALTRLIDVPAMRAKHVRDFLGPDYAHDKLPTVEQAQATVAQRRKLIEAFELARLANDQVPALPELQAARRAQVEGEAAALRQRQHEERMQLAAVQKAVRLKLKSAYLAEQKRVRFDRAQRKPTGLAAFLGQVTGIALVARKVQRYRDRKRYGVYLTLRATLQQAQQGERDALARGHELQAAALRRRLRALDQIEQRERQTLETAALKARRQAINARHIHMPSLAIAFTHQDGMTAREARAPRRSTPLAQELARAATSGRARQAIRLAEEFGRASGDDGDGDSGRGETGGPRPAAESKIEPKKKRTSRRLRQFNTAAQSGDDGKSGGQGDTGAPAPDAATKIRRRKRRRIKLERAFNEASGGREDSGGDDSGGPRKRRRQRNRKPPRDHDPPRPRHTRKRNLGRGM